MQTSYENTSNDEQQWREGPVARGIERQTAKLPSDLFLWGALAAVVASATMQVIGVGRGRKDTFMRQPARAPLSTFIGQWVPTLLLLGVYNKIVKVQGSDHMDRVNR